MDVEKLKGMAGASGASDWAIATEEGRTASFNIIPYTYFPGTEPRETLRPKEVMKGVVESQELTLFDRHGGKMGSSAKELTGRSEDYLREAIAELLQGARSQDNPPFELLEAGLSYDDVEITDPEIVSRDLAGLDTAVGTLKERMLAAAKDERVRLSNVEVYIRDARAGLLTSRGVSLSEPSTRVEVEFCVLNEYHGTTGEHTATLRGRKLAQIDTELVRRYAVYAREACWAEKPKDHEGPVVLTGDALIDFFAPQSVFGATPFTQHLGGENVYSGSSIFELGKPVCERFDGERITLISDPGMPFGLLSSAFSMEDGVPMRAVTLIDDGFVTGFLTSKQIYDYLGPAKRGPQHPTGPMANTRIACGRLPEKELMLSDGKPVYVVRAFSAFAPDVHSGAMKCEIRSGEVIHGRERYPIRGGLLIGNYFEALENAHFSSDPITSGSYVGPSAVRFERLKVSGD